MEDTSYEQDKTLRQAYLKIGKNIRYGTAGFRDLAENIEYITYRCGVFVSILNQTQPGKSLGIVVSASHNKIQDNGLKITNFHGNMLEMEYEPILEEFVNTENLKSAIDTFKEHLKKHDKIVYTSPVYVCIGGDTRPSTPRLLQLLTDAVHSQGGKVLNFGEVTTPQLQYYVYYINQKQAKFNATVDVQTLRPVFWKDFTGYYLQCQKFLNHPSIKTRTLDCANGIGGLVFPHFAPLLEPHLKFNIINNDNPEKLNDHCGADYVKTGKQFPLNYHKGEHNANVSFDGDADRIILYVEKEGKLALIDGDRVGTMLFVFYTQLIRRLKEETEKLNSSQENLHVALDFDFSVGLVQTYYANSASTDYLQKHYKIKTTIAATGVKFLHEKAEKFDIGIYFEGNGHGTVIFSKKINKIEALLNNEELQLKPLESNPDKLKQAQQYFKLLRFFWSVCKLPNPSVGDAICDLLLIEVALSYLKLDYQSFLELYTDYESRTSKIKVKNKHALKVTEIEDRVVNPEVLQQQIDHVLKEYEGFKAFVRASGTEDVLRLHVEAKNLETIQKIEKAIAKAIAQNKELN